MRNLLDMKLLNVLCDYVTSEAKGAKKAANLVAGWDSP